MKNKHYLYGIHAVTALLKNNPDQVVQLFIDSKRQDKRLQAIADLAHHHQLSIEKISSQKLDQYTEGGVHQGVVVLAKMQHKGQDLDTLLSQAKQPPLILVLDGIQDPHNLGACLRVADAAGVDFIITPKDRSASLTPSVRKIASGAAETVPVLAVSNLRRTLEQLQAQGIWLVGLTAAAQAKPIYQTDLNGPIALIMGSEQNGLRPLTEKQCDFLATIPMQGQVESLNVSVATGIALFEAQRQKQG